MGIGSGLVFGSKSWLWALAVPAALSECGGKQRVSSDDVGGMGHAVSKQLVQVTDVSTEHISFNLTA
jgi:hypothetical protein